MKKSILFLATFLMVLGTAHAQWGSKNVKGNGNTVTNTRNVGSYDGVKLVGSMNVQLVAGKEGKLRVEAESNLQEYIITEVQNGVLKISTEKGVDLKPKDDILITVPFESLNEISLTGSGDIWTTDKLKSSNLDVQITGSGDINLELEVKDLKGKITGSGDMQLRGKSDNFECVVTGSGDFDAYSLQSRKVEARVSGSGDIMVTATELLKANVSGSGDISYKGNPSKQDFKTHGSGSISSN